MTGNARLNRMLATRGLAPSTMHDAACEAPHTDVVSMRPPSGLVATPTGTPSVVRMRPPSGLVAAPTGTPSVVRMRTHQATRTDRIEASTATRTHMMRDLRRQGDAAAAEKHRALVEAVTLDIRSKNAEMEHNARMGYVDPDIMEPWQRRRRFG